MQDGFDTKYARQLIKQIPEDASVCAATTFVPHLALRPEIYDFFAMIDHTYADYVIIHKDYLDYRIGGQLIFKNRADYETVATDGTILLLKKKQLPTLP